MKNLVLGSLVALSGCIISSGGSDNAHIGATWKFQDIATHTTTGCPAGFDTAALYTQAADSVGNPIGTCTTVSNTCFIDLFNCTAGAGTSSALPPGNYITWMQIEEHDNVVPPYATTVSALLDVTDVDLTYNTQVLNDGGYFMLSWQLQGASSGAPLTCSQAGAQAPAGGVEAVATVSGSSESASDIFHCEDRFGVTAGYRAASYTVSVDALNQNMQAIGTAPALTNKAIGRQNQVTDLHTITIPITGM